MKFTVLKKVFVKLLGLFGATAVIRSLHNDPAPGVLFPPCPPSLRPWVRSPCREVEEICAHKCLGNSSKSLLLNTLAKLARLC